MTGTKSQGNSHHHRRHHDRIRIVPITIAQAKAFVADHHRTHPPPLSALFAVAAAKDQEIIGVATVGRPIAKEQDGGYTAELTRMCVLEHHPNACSMLYGACWRAAQALGYSRIITYTAQDQHGSSLKASGWEIAGTTRDHTWNTPSRPRDPASTGPKTLWAKGNHTPGPRPTYKLQDKHPGQLHMAIPDPQVRASPPKTQSS